MTVSAPGGAAGAVEGVEGSGRSGGGAVEVETRGAAAGGYDRPFAVGRAVVEVLPAWLVARVIVVGALALARGTSGTVRPGNAGALQRVQQGLLVWDAGWYRAIASHGYAAAGTQSLRFFPLYPLVAGALGRVPGVGIGTALVLVANVSALLAMAGLLLLVRLDLGDRALARRSVWLLALAPSAYTLVLGYADASLLLCAVVAFLGARTGRWWWAAAAGLAAGAVRPLGVLLVVPIAVELWRSRTRRDDRADAGAGPGPRRLARGAALIAPLAGAGAYLSWVAARFGDVLLPFRVQEEGGHRGPLASPFSAMWHNADGLLHGHHVGSALHIQWVLLCVVLLVLAFRRLPLSYGLFAAAVLAVSLTTSNLDSFERYALGAFPLVVVASTLTGRRWVEWSVLAASAAAMAGYAYLAFLGVVVP